MTEKLLVRWECVVLDLGVDSFWCRLVDLTQTEADCEAEIEYAKFPKKLVLGERFFWNVYGNEADENSGRNEFEFPPPVFFTATEIEDAKRRVDELAKILGW